MQPHFLAYGCNSFPVLWKDLPNDLFPVIFNWFFQIDLQGKMRNQKVIDKNKLIRPVLISNPGFAEMVVFQIAVKPGVRVIQLKRTNNRGLGRLLRLMLRFFCRFRSHGRLRFFFLLSLRRLFRVYLLFRFFYSTVCNPVDLEQSLQQSFIFPRCCPLVCKFK